MGAVRKTAVIYNKAHEGHRPETSSPENPERLNSIVDYLMEIDIFNEQCPFIQDFSYAKEEDVLLVHKKNYIDLLKYHCKQAAGFLGDSTYLSSDSYRYALLAAGGAIKASEIVLEGSSQSAFALIRPPGHHASIRKFGGYCLLNNGAIVARHLQKRKDLKKIMIIDWDAHAADGTMNIFYDDPTVLTVSLHRDPTDFYPHTGFPTQTGSKHGRGTCVNIIMPKTSGDEEYLLAIKEIVDPLYNQFKPDFVIGCNGFDAHFSDPNTKLRMTSKGYYQLVKSLTDMVGGTFVVLMEGGYTEYNGKLAHTIIEALKAREPPYSEEIDVPSDILFKEGKPRKTLQDNLVKLKNLLSDHYSFQ